MAKQKGINAKAWFYSQSFISSAQAEAELPVHMVCAETCTDEEFGGYFVDEAAALRVARKHPHAVQILPVSIEEFREARTGAATTSFQDQDDACGCGQAACDGRNHADAPLTAEEIEREESNQSPWANRKGVD